MIFRRKDPELNLGPLEQLLAERLPDADEGLRGIVAGIAGLLACVAYADGVYDPAEKETVRAELGRIHVLDEAAVEAIAALLEQHGHALAHGGDHAWAATLKEALPLDERLHVMDALLEVAAADGELATAETNYLRRLTTKLALSQDHYTALQSRHADKLGVLR